MKSFGRIINHLFMNRRQPVYSKTLFKFSSKYVDFCYGDNDFDRATNGEYRLLKEIAPRVKVVLDIGANIGDYSQAILDINKSASIHAFEPDPRAFEKLKGKKVMANNYALGKTVGTTVLHTHNNKTVLNSLLDIHVDGNISTDITVKIDTVDAYAKAHNIFHIDFMKIDVEGYEFFVLEGAQEMLKKQAIDLIQFEFSGASAFARTFLKDFIDLLAKCGYSLYRIKPLSIEKVIYYPDQERFTLTNYLAVRDGVSMGGMNVTKDFYH